eukprot:TRINITY_DN4709_c0_g1_i2.p1 TRINITY_DN4709_c0_g1~~TRINITY_DN4709_c0_g1_i2.p1  ORF type:complete len:105 (-),score=19.26 TRINITY_DN4709_c0_g1_i2:477-791(-)
MKLLNYITIILFLISVNMIIKTQAEEDLKQSKFYQLSVDALDELLKKEHRIDILKEILAVRDFKASEQGLDPDGKLRIVQKMASPAAFRTERPEYPLTGIYWRS